MLWGFDNDKNEKLDELVKLMDYIKEDKKDMFFMFNTLVSDLTVSSLVKCYVNDEALYN